MDSSERVAVDEELWNEVDGYIEDALTPADPVLTAALQSSTAAGLPEIQVAPNQGKLLNLLARLQSARSILEIGTLGGYSTIWLARALPKDGRLITLELDPKHAEVARKNVERAGLSGIVEVKLGAALETLPTLAAEKRGPFDLIFIDADKANIPEYFTWSLKMSRPGTLILVDNVVRGGAVIESDSQDESVRGVRKLFAMLA
ncbi:MAG TPA: O-methyltransferase, partial [Candidatus Polarisedimenticolia bacterium]|nr:O-methyltransferase [Candidatus Polarisedimenticolia bacterium]